MQNPAHRSQDFLAVQNPAHLEAAWLDGHADDVRAVEFQHFRDEVVAGWPEAG